MLKCQAGCSTSAELMQEARHRGLLPEGSKQNPGAPRQIEVEYDYIDAKGNLLYQVVRFKPKDFRQRRPDGSGEWLWNVPAELRTLYHLPEVLAAKAMTPIYLTEGEKDEPLEGV